MTERGSEETARAIADELLAAARSRVPVDPLPQRHPGLTLDAAYAAQLAQVGSRLAAGARLKGHKVGLTAAAMREQLGIDQPDYGHLLDDMFFLERTPIPAGLFIQPRIEPEVAFVLSAPLRGPGLTVADVIAATGFVLPALEIIDSRIRDWRISLLDTVADNGSSAGVVLGSHPSPLHTFDLRTVQCTLRRGGERAGTGRGDAVLGSPVNAVVWLANTLGERGAGLDPGHVVLPGAVTAAIPVAPGDVVEAAFTGLGEVTAIFSDE
jgi:2-keto-4-pentenoate hydratase